MKNLTQKNDCIIETFDEFRAKMNNALNESENYDSDELSIDEFYELCSNNDWLEENLPMSMPTGNYSQSSNKKSFNDKVKDKIDKGSAYAKDKVDKGTAYATENPGKTVAIAGGAAALGAGAIALKRHLAKKRAAKAAAARQPVNASLSFAAIGAGAITTKLYENDANFDNDTYLLSYMDDDQLIECVDAFYNFVGTYGYHTDFINECVDAFYKISNNTWDIYESYITEGYDEEDTSSIEESADLVVFAAENVNELLESAKEKAKEHMKKHGSKYAVGAGAAALGALGYNTYKNIKRKYKRGKELPDAEGRSKLNTLARGHHAELGDYFDKQGKEKSIPKKAKLLGKAIIDDTR